MNQFNNKKNKNYCINNSCNNNSKKLSPLTSLHDVENFLCNINKAIKCFNFYKFFK